MITVAVYIGAFILLSGLMAAIDAAILSVTLPEIDELIHQKKPGALQLRKLKEHISRCVVVIVILTNTINVLGPVLVSHQAVKAFGPESLAAVTVILAFGTILFSEIFPKAIGTHYAPVVGRLAAGPLKVVGTIISPLVIGLAWLSDRCTPGSRPIGTERQVRALALMGRKAGHIESDEILMIYRVFRLNDSTAKDIMTPVDDVIALSAEATVQEAAQQVRDKRYSRYPVYEGSLNDVEGFVTGRDILEAMVDGREESTIGSIAQKVLRFEGAQRSDELLMVFRDEHIHLGIVKEGGTTLGVVTLEDVLEELVGEIEDEKD